MDRPYEPLRREFDAGPGSFLLALRCELTWSKPAFRNLVTLMGDFVETYASRTEPERATIERWAAEGFWYIHWFVQDWTRHPDFPREYEDEYCERAYGRLWDLAFQLFFDLSPGHRDHLPPFED